MLSIFYYLKWGVFRENDKVASSIVSKIINEGRMKDVERNSIVISLNKRGDRKFHYNEYTA